MNALLDPSRPLVFAIFVLANPIAPHAASAHPQVDRGVELLDRADFQGAIEALNIAYRAPTLERPALARLLIHRALAHHALRDEALMQDDLRRLAVVAPQTPLPRYVPPEVAQAFELARKADPAVALDVETQRWSGGIRIRAETTRAPASLARKIRVVTRLPGRNWQARAADTRVEVVRASKSLDYYVEALGPGDVVLARQGSADAPRHIVALPHIAWNEPEVAPVEAPLGLVPGAPASAPTQDTDDGISPWWLAGAGAVVSVTATAILIGVLASSGNDAQHTTVQPPELTP